MIRDNRFDAFNKTIGFEFDEYSRLWVPKGTQREERLLFQMPSFHSTFSNKGDAVMHDLNAESLERMLETMARTPGVSVWHGYHGEVLDGSSEGQSDEPKKLGDAVAAWLDEMNDDE